MSLKLVIKKKDRYGWDYRLVIENYDRYSWVYRLVIENYDHCSWDFRLVIEKNDRYGRVYQLVIQNSDRYDWDYWLVIENDDRYGPVEKWMVSDWWSRMTTAMVEIVDSVIKAQMLFLQIRKCWVVRRNTVTNITNILVIFLKFVITRFSIWRSTLDITNQFLHWVPWHFVESRFHCKWCIFDSIWRYKMEIKKKRSKISLFRRDTVPF